MAGDQALPRIHWVSPLPPAETDIAAYTLRVLPALRARAEVVLWTDAERWDPAIERLAPVRRYDAGAHFPMPLDGLAPMARGAEIAVFHIGNSWLYHAGPLNLARRVPGIVVFHDLGLQDLLRGCLEHGHFDAPVYLEEMGRWYGSEGRVLAEQVVGDGIRPHRAAARMPGFEIAFRSAVAAMTHTRAGVAALAARARLPVYGLDLPFEPGPHPGATRASSGPLRLVQFGYIGQNRRLEAVLDAIAAVEPRVDARLDIFGTLWDRPFVEARIRALGLGERVVVRGFVSEDELDAALARAHLVFNLRNPSMGEASGSQLRIWNAAAAAVVSDLGWYAGLPDETVFKVPAEGEAAALAEVLVRLDRDRGRGAAVGEAGRARLDARHRPERYADGLLRVAAAYAQDARDGLLADAGRRVLGEMPSPGLARRCLADRLG
ncbi:MAG: glycosyltransferase [Paracoccaceae bacterium]